ncbi:squalene cyclase [Microbacterium sp. H1-D42]|uniref:squalene cyclase n=1 Tax=Microbacterium sp. H1-D42 TaxID=2925844 RepID=UPI001F5395BD|nr:squalene cyclase [Microbacterium sp. H1-D42]UNK69821.1 squalene cyclase [Microbacterium sp. H1-D42]
MSSLTDEKTDWLRESDPALRWQVERDLLGLPENTWQATRALVETEGVGAAILARQDADGQWAGGAYFPSREFDGAGASARDWDAQPWIATTWALKDLRDLGLDAAALSGTAEKLAANCVWEFEDRPYWGGEIDVCINGFTLATGAWLGADVSAIAAWFPEHRLADGGWNCEAEEGDSVRSSFHSTLNAVVEMLAYETLTGDGALRAARHAGEEYLLERRLLRRLSTGELVAPWVTDFIAPSRWQYSALAALDHFRRVAEFEGTEPDPRLAEAVESVRAARQPDGTWLQGDSLPGAVWIDIDVLPGEPSKWLTLIGARVLDWWDAAQPAG